MISYSEADIIKSYLINNHIDRLYHFTDRSNVLSIIKNGGLYSWYSCDRQNIHIRKPGGDSSSRSLDSFKGYEDYVRLSFCHHHPMMYTAKKEGRISEPVIIEISIDVCNMPDVLFSDINATANGACIGKGIDALRNIDTNIVRRDYIGLADEQKPKYQAEVLVKQKVPLEYFLNYKEIEDSLTQNEKDELRQWQDELRKKEIADIKNALPTPSIILLEQDEINYNDQKIRISWRVNNSTRIFINGQEILGYRSSYELDAGSTSCCLTAINETKYKDGSCIKKEISKTICLRQYPAPAINIVSSELLVKKGQENRVTISWHLSNVQSAEIYIGDKIEPLSKIQKGSKILILSDKTTIYIKAIGLDGKREFNSERIEIDAKNEAVINSFTTDKLYSITDVPFIISWSISDANKAYIKANNKTLVDNLALMGAGQYTLQDKTILTLCAEDDFGIKQHSIELDVMPKPHIQFISIPIPEIECNINMRVLLTRPQPSVTFPNIINTKAQTFVSTKLRTNKLPQQEIKANEQLVHSLAEQSINLRSSRSHKLTTLVANIKNIAQRILKNI